MTAAAIIQHVGRDVWDAYLTIAVDRNPWDRLVSLYYYATRNDQGAASFPNWLRTVRPAGISNYHRYALDSAVAVNRVLRYETLSTMLPALLREVGIVPSPLVQAKSQYRPPWTRDWRVMYDDESGALVAKRCKREIDLFDYRFDDPAPTYA
jgi:hypothetical protein